LGYTLLSQAIKIIDEERNLPTQRVDLSFIIGELEIEYIYLSSESPIEDINMHIS
jgi:hypothetical protein